MLLWKGQQPSEVSLWKNVRHNFQSFFAMRINSEPGTATVWFSYNDFSVQTVISNLGKTWHIFVADRAADACQHNVCSAPTYLLVISTLLSLFLLSLLFYLKGYKTWGCIKTSSFCQCRKLHILCQLAGVLLCRRHAGEGATHLCLCANRFCQLFLS